jgi:hypothetical protein
MSQALSKTPNYTKIKIPNPTPAATSTKHKTVQPRIKDQIKFLYMKKEKLNNALYKVQLKAAQGWGKKPGAPLKSQ